MDASVIGVIFRREIQYPWTRLYEERLFRSMKYRTGYSPYQSRGFSCGKRDDNNELTTRGDDCVAALQVLWGGNVQRFGFIYRTEEKEGAHVLKQQEMVTDGPHSCCLCRILYLVFLLWLLEQQFDPYGLTLETLKTLQGYRNRNSLSQLFMGCDSYANI
ncbi:hypothetical protein STEG23_003366, partial [Scotinomys teguina]